MKNIKGRYLAKSQMVRCTAIAARFDFVNFRGSHFKKVSFKNAILTGCDFWGSSFKDCSFENVIIADCVFVACKFKNCNFTGAVIKYSTIVNTSLKECKEIKLLENVKVLNQYPKINIDTFLLQTLKNLKEDKYIRKNKLLHLPG
ncbi:pentapeptide repeat-containing protein, partial [Salmonella enterica subsp. enterica serovar Enteritidis]|uniref:pentapeptide repeat-containing protein n=1 Tax=Salmonella enterica TaxID=28901 RepID=UPI001624343E